MLSLPTIEPSAPVRRLPSWLKRRLPNGNGNFFTQDLLRELRLETVCENARCPNRPECYSAPHRHVHDPRQRLHSAVRLLLGPARARRTLEDDEPARVAEAAQRLGLKHVVITSVTRDDLPDGGADHFRRCILAVRDARGPSSRC